MSFQSKSHVIAVNRPPRSVIVVGLLFIVAGIGGFIHHAGGFTEPGASVPGTIWVLALRVLAFAIGVLLLRGTNAARWLAVAWLAYHMVLSMFHSWSEMIAHVVLLPVIAIVLFRPVASAYFRRAPQPTSTNRA